jgi:hypothetical protein
LPWWIRNAVVTGDPFFSFYGQLAYHDHVPAKRVRPSYTYSVMHYLDPTTSPTRLDSPFEKLRSLLPILIKSSPLYSASLVACVGVVVGCIRRNRLTLVFAAFAVLSTIAIALVLPRGRYFAPLFPMLLVFGAIGWRSLGNWPGALGMAGILASPLLPSPIPPPSDLAYVQAMIARPRPPSSPPRWKSCIASDDLVVSELASDMAWKTDATTIWLPATEADLWNVLERFPIDFVYLHTRRDLLSPRFVTHFEKRADCGQHLYQRRDMSLSDDVTGGILP